MAPNVDNAGVENPVLAFNAQQGTFDNGLFIERQAADFFRVTFYRVIERPDVCVVNQLYCLKAVLGNDTYDSCL